MARSERSENLECERGGTTHEHYIETMPGQTSLVVVGAQSTGGARDLVDRGQSGYGGHEILTGPA